MNRILCKLENASESINEVEFSYSQDFGGMLSAPIDDETALLFKDIPGYSLIAEPDGEDNEEPADSLSEEPDNPAMGDEVKPVIDDEVKPTKRRQVKPTE